MKKLAADLAITLEDEFGFLRPLKRPLITVDEDGKILEIRQYNEDELHSSDIEYHPGILVPGFVNAHSHIELSHLKGVFKEGTGMSGFINQINELRESVDEKGRREAMEREFENLSRSGVVAVSDISNCAESFALKKKYLTLKHTSENSLFPVYYRTFVELFGTEPEDAEKTLNYGQKIADEALAMGLDAAVTPHSVYTMSPKLLEITAERALKSGFISFHSQESMEEDEMIRTGSGALSDNYKGRHLSVPPVTGTSSLEYFVDRLLTFAKPKIAGKINLVHNVTLDRLSIEKANANLLEPYFTVCPLSNIFIHRELPPLNRMRLYNLTICLGTDSLSSNHLLNMVAEMKCIQENFPYIHLCEILTWACLNGAKALGIDGWCGSLKVGKRPGVVLLENIKDFRLTELSKSQRLA